MITGSCFFFGTGKLLCLEALTLFAITFLPFFMGRVTPPPGLSCFFLFYSFLFTSFFYHTPPLCSQGYATDFLLFILESGLVLIFSQGGAKDMRGWTHGQKKERGRERWFSVLYPFSTILATMH